MASLVGDDASRNQWLRIGNPVFALSLLGLAAAAHLMDPLKAVLVQRLAFALEHRIPPASLPSDQSLAGIIVLGGSHKRVEAALQLAERYPQASIILSGPGTREIALAQTAAVTAGRLTIDRRPKNTYENALFSSHLVGPEAGHWVVVTSALHMPRAFASFSAVDFPVLPWPVKDTPAAPDKKSSAVWHEVLGLLGYWALGRTHALYPDPPGQYDEPSSLAVSGGAQIAPSS
ncbi:MAG: YdcF family protein [Hyphomicrobiaceae bacterium]|nr:YdcF family protein [Hyphomicrobiaceae bacterium]